MFLPAFLQISSVTYAEPGRGAKSRWDSEGRKRQKGLAPARAYKDIKIINCWNIGVNYKRLYNQQLNQGNRCKQRKATHTGSDIIFVILSFMYFLVSANKSVYLGHTTSIIVVYQSLGLIWDLTALERNVFGLEGIADQQAVSTFCLFPQIFLFPHLSSFLCRYWALSLQHCRLAQIFLPNFLLSYQ